MSTDDLVVSLPIQSDRIETGHPPPRPLTPAGRGWSSSEASPPNACCLGGVRFHARVAATWTPVNDLGRPANRGRQWVHRRRPECSFLDVVRHGGTQVLYSTCGNVIRATGATGARPRELPGRVTVPACARRCWMGWDGDGGCAVWLPGRPADRC